MILLGFDTATSATAVALRLSDGASTEARDDPSLGERPSHTSDLLGLAISLMDGAAVQWSGLEGIAVGLGPGTFTGLRVGVATARGLAQSLDLPLIGVSSLRALALPALGATPVLAVLDARRGEVFLAAYASEQDGARGDGARGDGARDGVQGHGSQGDGAREILEPQACKPEDLTAVLAALGGEPPRAVGDGAIRYRAQLQAAGALVASDDSPQHLLRAGAVCELAERQGVGAPLDLVLPRYGRRSDAEIAIEAAAG